jgi:hypothetical protein
MKRKELVLTFSFTFNDGGQTKRVVLKFEIQFYSGSKPKGMVITVQNNF